MAAKFSIYEFSAKELQQIVAMVRENANGYILNVKRTGKSKQVMDYALRWNLIEQRDDKKFYYTGSRFNPLYDLPVEALWLIVEPMLKGQQSIGRSIAFHPAWLDLNIWPQGHRFATNQTLGDQYDILFKLQQYGYLIVQTAGSVWEITRWHNAA